MRDVAVGDEPSVHCRAIETSRYAPNMREFQSNRLVRPVMPELDSIRGLAILGVVFYHGFFWGFSSTLHFSGVGRTLLALTQPGIFGVNLFFVLSGFLISGILLDSLDNPVYYRRFYIRRALRILPVYYALLILLLAMGWITAGYFALSFIYLSNVTSLFGVSPGYGPLWSLAVEEHYYIFWPLIVRKLTRSQLTWCALGICLLVPALRAISFHFGYKNGLQSYTWFAIDGLAGGSLLAILVRSRITRKRAWWISAAYFGTAILATAAAPLGILTADRALGAALKHTLVNSFFSGVLLLFLLLGTSSWKGLVNPGWLRFFGYISYGLYLFHLMIFHLYDLWSKRFWPSLIPLDYRFDLVALRFVVAGAVAVGFSVLSRKYFEAKLLALKGPIEARFAPRAAAVPGAIEEH